VAAAQPVSSNVRAHLRRRISFARAPSSGAARSSAAFGRTALAVLNCSSSTGAPSSSMNATRTPADGSVGAIKTSLPFMASSKSSTAKAMCGTLLTISGPSQCASHFLIIALWHSRVRVYCFRSSLRQSAQPARRAIAQPQSGRPEKSGHR